MCWYFMHIYIYHLVTFSPYITYNNGLRYTLKFYNQHLYALPLMYNCNVSKPHYFCGNGCYTSEKLNAMNISI